MRRFTLIALAFALLAGGATRPAAASVTGCGTNNVTVTLDPIVSPATTIKHGAGTALLIDGTQCGNVSHLRTVHIQGTGGFLGAVLDLGGGAFSDTAGDMHFTVSFPDLTSELDVIGGSLADRVVLGSSGINLDAATTTSADVALSGLMVVRLVGAGNNDVLSGAGGSGTGGPTSRPMILEGDAGNDLLIGGSALDALNGHAGADSLYGLGGNDILYGVADGANDKLVGGPGKDALWSNDSGVHINLATGIETGPGYGTDSLAGIEDVQTGNDAVVTGDAYANRVDAGTGALVHGGGGNDTLNATGSVHGDAGNDLIYDVHVSGLTYDGGAGFDMLDARYGLPPALTIDIGAGTVSSATETNVHLVSVEGAFGGPGNDHLRGSINTNILVGLAGNDTLLGLAGNDYLIGGDGNDTIDGGTGTDNCQQNAGTGPVTNCP